MPTPHRPLLDVPAAATYLGTTERHLRELVYRRQITYTKVGRLLRFSQDHLDEYLEANTVRAAS